MNLNEKIQNWKKLKFPLVNDTSIIYCVNSKTKQRKAVGILFGKFEKRKKSAIWLKPGNSYIEIVAKTHLYDLDDDDQAVYNGINSNKYIIHEKNSGGKVAFCGEDEPIYLFDRSSSIIINLKPIFKTPSLPNTKTIDGANFIHLDGITVLVIKEGMVLVECITGKIYIHCLQVTDYNLEVPISFNAEPQKRALAAQQSSGKQLLNNAKTPQSQPQPQSESESDFIRQQLIKLKERIEGYAVFAVKEDNLKVAQNWNDLIQS